MKIILRVMASISLSLLASFASRAPYLHTNALSDELLLALNFRVSNDPWYNSSVGAVWCSRASRHQVASGTILDWED